MKRRIFWQRAAAGIALAAVLFSIFAFTVWWSVRDYARIELDKTYYLLVRECDEETSVSVSTQVYLSGGAGYLIKKGRQDCVVLSCYYTERDAELVRRNLTDKGLAVQTVEYASADFELGGSAAAYAQRIVANVETADSNARLLFDTANKLERTEISQEEARAAVRGAVASLGGLRQSNEGAFFERWNAALLSAERKGREIASGILFAKDIRYLQVQLTAAVVNADSLFA